MKHKEHSVAKKQTRKKRTMSLADRVAKLERLMQRAILTHVPSQRKP